MKTFIGLITFLLFLCSPIIFEQWEVTLAFKMGFICCLMGLWWLAQIIPLAATALFPLVACPYLGICSTKVLAPQYMNSIIVIFIGGFLMADAISKTNLHVKFSLKIVKLIGQSEKLLLLGFMLVSCVLSMAISNTATTLMVYAISLALLKKESQYAGNLESILPLAIAYSASIGGMGTLLGTPPNLILAQVMEAQFPSFAISYFDWLIWGVPLSLILLILGWFLFTKFFLIQKSEKDFKKLKKELLKEEENNRGFTLEQCWVFLCFILLVIGWSFRKNISFGQFSISGWSSLLSSGKFYDDGTVSMMMAFPLFFLKRKNSKEKILDVESIKNIPWGTLILFGGGFAMAKGMKISGLADEIGQQLLSLSDISPLALLGFITTTMTFLTEFTSNTASSQIFLPILAIASKALKLHPYILLIPTTMASSLAFMLPAATAPNAIAFASGRVPLKLMMKVGFFFNIIGLILINILGCLIYLIYAEAG